MWVKVEQQVVCFLFDGRFAVKQRVSTEVCRRDLLRAMMTGGAAAAAAKTVALETAAAGSTTGADKRRARYQPNSREAQEFYRVNRYPTH
jgi:hypothetical protein